MVQPATKPKSESALPPAKSRKTSLSPPLEPENQSSDGLSIQDAPVAAKHVKKRARKSEPAPKTRVDEYDEDPGRTESQTFLALVEFESKKKRKMNKENKGYMEKFEKGIDEKKGRLRALLAREEKESNKRDTQFLETFKIAYGASRGQASAAQDFASMYKKSKDITATAFALVGKFEEVAKRISDLDTSALVENEWGEQDEVFAGLLEEGKRLGIERYRRMLTASKEQTLDKEDKVNADLFYDEQKKAVGWGKVVKKQEKAFKKLVKTVEILVEADVDELA